MSSLINNVAPEGLLILEAGPSRLQKEVTWLDVIECSFQIQYAKILWIMLLKLPSEKV